MTQKLSKVSVKSPFCVDPRFASGFDVVRRALQFNPCIEVGEGQGKEAGEGGGGRGGWWLWLGADREG